MLLLPFLLRQGEKRGAHCRATPWESCWAQSLAVPLTFIRCQDTVTDGLPWTLLTAKTRVVPTRSCQVETRVEIYSARKGSTHTTAGSSSYLVFH